MADPRLNSIHLEMPRRQAFRQAREVVLNARGNLTLMSERPELPDRSAPDDRIVSESVLDRLRTDPDYILMDRDKVYPLKVGLNTVGRLPDNDVVLEDPYVSRRHCAIVVHASKGCELHDVASKNGTFLNGRKLNGPTPLVSGDELRMCDRQFIFMSKNDLDAAHGDMTLSE